MLAQQREERKRARRDAADAALLSDLTTHKLRAATFQAWALACCLPAGPGVAVVVASYWHRRHRQLLAAAASLQVECVSVSTPPCSTFRDNINIIGGIYAERKQRHENCAEECGVGFHTHAGARCVRAATAPRAPHTAGMGGVGASTPHRAARGHAAGGGRRGAAAASGDGGVGRRGPRARARRCTRRPRPCTRPQ